LAVGLSHDQVFTTLGPEKGPAVSCFGLAQITRGAATSRTSRLRR